MTEKTRNQPNFRITGDLRKLRGLDYILCLRGLEAIGIFDYDQWKKNKQIVQVRDFSFFMDMENSACREMTVDDLQVSRVRRLAPKTGSTAMWRWWMHQ